MKEKDIKLIKNINEMILEMYEKTRNINQEEFFDNIELINKCINYIYTIKDIIKELNNKNKHKNINWNIIENNMYYDKVFKESIKAKAIWKLSSETLYKELYLKLKNIIKEK